MTMAIRLLKMMIGQRRPRRGPSEIQTATSEYAAVKALPIVGYSFYNSDQRVSVALRVKNQWKERTI